MMDSLNEIQLQIRLKRLLPLYVSAYAVLLCGLLSYINTNSDDSFGVRGVIVVLAGMAVSLFCRLRQLRQNTIFGILAGMVAVIIFWVSYSGATPFGQLMMFLANGRNNGPGMMLAWFVMLYSFAMIADEVIIFSVVPSIALLGLMASENPNGEIVVYFLGLVLSAVFMLVYENSLSHDRDETDERLSPLRSTLGTATTFGSDDPADHQPVRSSLLLAAVVMALALVVGFGAAWPLQVLGRTISDHAPQINMPAAAEFASEVTNRYINQLDLTGAPPHLSDRIVMQIHAPQPYYWRGKVFDTYTGSSWTGDDSSEMLEEAQDENGYQSWGARPLRNDDQVQETLAREGVWQFVRTYDPPLGGVLVGAGEPQRIWCHLPLREDKYRAIRVPETRTPTAYRMYSEVSVATDNQLRHASTRIPMAYRYAYTHLNDDGHETRLRIAQEVTAGFSTEFDKVKALEHYLQNNFSYTLSPPRTPSNQDAVTYFLTTTKQGYCEIFASSMAVLCRELGIPARLATGFAPGAWRIDRYRGGGISVVREKDLHAWTEVYFPGYGWIPFDPTSSREASTSWTDTFRDFFRGMISQLTPRTAGPAFVLVGIMGIGLFLFKAYGLDPIWRSTWLRSLLAYHRRDLSPEQKWDLLYTRSHRRLKPWAGLKRAHQTPFEFADRVRPALPADAGSAFDALTRLYVAGAFRRGGPGARDVALMVRLDMELRAALHTAPRPAPAPVPAPEGAR